MINAAGAQRRRVVARRLATVLLGASSLTLPFFTNAAQAQDSCQPLSQYPVGGSQIVLSSEQTSAGVVGSSPAPGKTEGDHGPDAPQAPAITLLNCGSITASLLAESKGGNGAYGRDAVWPVTPGWGGRGGDGGPVFVENLSGATISTVGVGMYGYSLGGNGGDGGGATTFGSGANGGIGGNGGNVTLVNLGTITTTGENAQGMFGLTVGGQAGLGGSGGWFNAHSGTGGAGGNSGSDAIGVNEGTIKTSGANSSAIALHSIGGTGGEGGSNSAGFYAIGGNGGPGGEGGRIDATNTGTITTTGYNSKGISALSIGGGGGDGGSAFAAGLIAGVAIGGYGGNGGAAGAVNVTNSGSIDTTGYGSLGIRAQSVGGGGGDGGSASAVAVGTNFSFTFAMGGSGGKGGDGGAVSVTNASNGTITTGSIASLDQSKVSTTGQALPGDSAAGILAQSVGGGGGNGHQSFSLSAAAAFGTSLSASVNLGGSGGDGGKGGNVIANSAGTVTTYGRFAPGLIAHSVGGGGGNGGNTVAIDATVSNTAGTLNFSLAGVGGDGNSSGTVSSTVAGAISTVGTGSTGVVAQSIAGGGGNGGNAFDSGTAIGNDSLNIGVSMGGKGGAGGQAGSVTSSLQSGGSVTTYGAMAGGLLTQSIGGGGGNGGSVQSYAVSLQGGEGTAGNVSVNLGGSASNGGAGGSVQQTVGGTVTTMGEFASGVMVQSIGGGGGNGGHVFALDISAAPDTGDTGTESSAKQVSVAVGGSGGAGANGASAALNFTGTIATSGGLSAGAIVQSIGGGGGNGGSVRSFSLATALPTSLESLGNRMRDNLGVFQGTSFEDKTNLDIGVNVGGSGGDGGVGGDASATLGGGSINTTGNLSAGVVVQSIGGGGGTGGSTVADGFAGVSSTTVRVGIGGKGGSGTSGGSASVVKGSAITSITTSGAMSYGVVAQSIGGGGGIGGSTHTDILKIPKLSGSGVAFDFGGKGGSGNLGGTVQVDGVNVTTSGTHANAILAQSIGGGGGNGNAAFGSGVTEFNFGGNGGNGNHGGTVYVNGVATHTTGSAALGVLAQSIGGGGGNSGLYSMSSLVSAESQVVSTQIDFNVSGSGGDGGIVNVGCAGLAQTNCGITTDTRGKVAIGVFAQSIGGGGGLIQAAPSSLGPVSINILGQAGRNGASGTVTVADNQSSTFNIITRGDGATGIVAQSFDAGGGSMIVDTAGATTTANIAATTAANNGGVAFNLSGTVGTGGNNASAVLIQALSGAYTLHTTTGTTLYGGTTVNNAKTSAIVQQSGNVFTGGSTAHGIELRTNSNAASAYVPTGWSPPADPGQIRAQTVMVEGTVSTGGANAWGIYSTNGNAPIAVEQGQVTTHIAVASGASVGASNATGGGIFVKDYGSAVVEVLGTVMANNAPAISLQAQNAQLLIASQGRRGGNGMVQGNVEVTGMGAGSTASIQVDGTITGTLTALGNGGTLSIKGEGYFGRQLERDGFLTLLPNGQRAITVDAGVTSIQAGAVYGDIVGPAVGSMANPIPLALSQMTGSVIGNFALNYDQFSSYHGMGINLAGGHTDTINVASMSQGGPSEGIDLYLTALPVGEFRPVTLITVANGMAGGSAQSVFGLNPQSLATSFDIAVSTPEGGPATAVLTGVSIDYTRVTKGGNLQAVAVLANQQVDAIKSGSVTPDHSSDLYTYLLVAAQSETVAGVTGSLQILEASLHYGTAASAAAARQQGFNALYSCGGAATITMDPISQGECSWAKYLAHDSERASVGQTYQSRGMAAGQQYEVGDTLFLGFGANYQSIEGRSLTSSSKGDRFGLGAVLKYVKGRNFGSVAVSGSYDWINGSRHLAAEATSTSALTARMEQEVATLGAQLRVGRQLVSKPFDVIVRADFDMVMVRDGGYTESGAGQFDLRVASETNWLFNATPTIQLGKRVKVGDMGVRLYGEAGRNWQFNDLTSHVRLASGFDTDYSAAIVHHRDNETMTYGLGLMVDVSDRVELRLNYDTTDGDDYHGTEFGGKLAIKF